jgi:hypothetical protein
MQDQQEKTYQISRAHRVAWARYGLAALLVVGVIILAMSVLFESPAMSFVGLGLVFMGGILAYVRADDYVKTVVSQAVAGPMFVTLDRIIRESNLKGKAIYLPPRFPKDPETYLVYIPRADGEMPPSPEQVRARDEELLRKDDSMGVVLQPPGAGLSMLMEKTLKTSFAKQSLAFLERNLPRLFIDSLELAQDLRMEIRENKILVVIRNPFRIEPVAKDSKITVYDVLGWTISSAIACALAKASGRMVVIDSQQAKRSFQEIRIEYSLLKEME